MRASVLALLACCVAAETMAQQLVVPDAPDLMLKTRRIDSGFGREQPPLTQVLYLKGARQRRETYGTADEAGRKFGFLSITHCDEHRTLELDAKARTYAYREIEDPSAYVERMRKFGGTELPPLPADAPVTKVTIDSTDTGERRPFGSYTARHVITTRTTEPPAGLYRVSMRTVFRQDGWYIDVPETNCWEHRFETETFLVAAMPRSSMKVEHRGNGRTGYPIEERYHESSTWGSRESKLELVDVSEAPLDDALFEVPKGYQLALQTPYGPEMSKPDTILNRVSWYGNQMVATVWRWFNSPPYGQAY
jgi:hypothetical protein